MMKAAVMTSPGGPEVFEIQQREIPPLQPHEVLVQVRAAGINRPDVIQRQGKYPAPKGVPADIPGLEVAGIIAACGTATSQWKVGDRVCALVAGGGYAEYVAVHESHCLAVPIGIDFTLAASMPETVFTVWDNVFRRGKLQKGEGLLVHGGSGGIGTTAIQLGVAFGATVYATAGSDDKCRFCESIGATRCVNYKTEDFQEVLQGRAINVVLDSIGGDYFQKNIDLLREDGRLVYINAMKGRKVELNLLQLMQKRILLTGSTLRARDSMFKAHLREDIEKKVWPLFMSGAFKPLVHQVFPLAEVVEAHRLMDSGDFHGKLVLSL